MKEGHSRSHDVGEGHSTSRDMGRGTVCHH